MSDPKLVQKFQLKPGQRALIVNPPADFLSRFAPLPDGAEVSTDGTGPFGFILIFTQNRAALNEIFSKTLAKLAPDGIYWVAYPKKTGSLQTDLTRDKGWEAMEKAGYRGVRLISVDADWSAMRVAPAQSEEDLIAAQYAGAKAALKPIYDQLDDYIMSLGPDVRRGIRKTYVGFKRKRQFVLVQASTRERVDIGIRLESPPDSPRIQPAGNFGSGSLNLKISLSSTSEVDAELKTWLTQAYEAA